MKDMKDTAKSGDDSLPGMQVLRSAIPAHCWERSTFTSASYILRDLTLFVGLGLAALKIPTLESGALQAVAWASYGLVQGMVLTGMWILGHECGHGALFENQVIGDSFGFLLHSLTLVPYYSYKYSHAKHHRYTNHIEKEVMFVPVRETQVRPFAWVEELLYLDEDSPVFALIELVSRQLFGWPSYLIYNLSAGEKMLEAHNGPEGSRQNHFNPATGGHNHFNPGSGIFSKNQRPYVLLSDLGLMVVLAGLWWAAQKLGWWQVGLLYGVPWFGVNHWLGCIAYLHHNHADKPYYEDKAWTFQKGALSTVDREFGFIGKHFFHGLVEFHVIHHLFPRIPFYHAEEATYAIQPLLGKYYLRDETPLFKALWESFTTLRYVRPSESDPNLLTWSAKPVHSLTPSNIIVSH